MFKTVIRETIFGPLKKTFLTTFQTISKHDYRIGSLSMMRVSFTAPNPLISSLGKVPYSHETSSNGLVSVKHNEKRNFFYIDEPNCKARLRYRKHNEVVRILSTLVPKTCGGRGYGKKLAETALEWIADNEYSVIIECDFVQAYVRYDRPEFQKYVIT